MLLNGEVVVHVNLLKTVLNVVEVHARTVSLGSCHLHLALLVFHKFALLQIVCYAMEQKIITSVFIVKQAISSIPILFAFPMRLMWPLPFLHAIFSIVYTVRIVTTVMFASLVGLHKMEPVSQPNIVPVRTAKLVLLPISVLHANQGWY